jgi:hypothetical protein
MSSSLPRERSASAQLDQQARRPWLWIIAAIVLVVGVGGGALYLMSNGYGSGGANKDGKQNQARSYRTIAKTELRAEANQAARLVVSLREGTTVSGIPAGDKDGVDWLEITAVDGTKGFVPKSLLKELGPSTASTEIKGGMRRLVTSATVNLRETPSLSGKILGVAEGGTRLVSDGSIQSEGEDWLRVPIDGQTTVFIMQRFTTSDDDAGGNDGIEGGDQANIGVRAFATQIANVQATPMSEARIVRALQLNEEVRVIGQTNAGRSWYVLRLTDGSQGFAPREAIRIDPSASRWMYPDGTPAPGPNIPKGSTVAIVAGTTKSSGTNAQRRGQNNAASQSSEATGEKSTGGSEANSGPSEKQQTPDAPAPTTTDAPQPADVVPVPGPQ